ncbi:MAG: hypothetical protein IT385_05050 [Deltaproteobacteria bacterium]|nr:hypothetical protein [Deltaproteobacteria bacterium]
MGQVVSADAARETIVADAEQTLTNARARQGELLAEAEAALGPALALYHEAASEAAAADRAAADARARRQVANDTADGIVVEVVDDLFEAGGRTRHDPFLAVALPGGAGPIAGGALEDQPARMRLAARLLGKVNHPRIPKATLVAAADRLAAAANPLADVIDQTRDVIVTAEVADKTLTALARVVRSELIGLKRRWIGQRMSETEIHKLIPDRPSARPKPKDEDKKDGEG